MFAALSAVAEDTNWARVTVGPAGSFTDACDAVLRLDGAIVRPVAPVCLEVSG